MSEFDSQKLRSIFDLLVSVGYVDEQNAHLSPPDKVAAGLVWSVSAVKASGQSVVADEILHFKHEIKIGKGIEKSLRLIGCPHSLQASQIQDLDCEGVYPVVEWLVNRIKALQEGINNEVREKHESDFQSQGSANCSNLQAEVTNLEETIARGDNSESLSNDFDHSLCDSMAKLNSAKRELAARLRTILQLRRQLGEVPSQLELIQYERRFSELYVNIQEKLRQTRKYYGTYNALLDIKELMLKEISLLNSISSQFQDAINSAVGRMKLIDSMEGIVKGIQQKLEKVQLGLQGEQKVCDAFKERYAASIAEQRRCYSLLKVFQEECAKNERLRSHTSA